MVKQDLDNIGEPRRKNYAEPSQGFECATEVSSTAVRLITRVDKSSKLGWT